MPGRAGVYMPMKQPHKTNGKRAGRLDAYGCLGIGIAVMLVAALSSCSGHNEKVEANAQAPSVGVTSVVKKTLSRQITLSSELVPFQEIDVYASRRRWRGSSSTCPGKGLN